MRYILLLLLTGLIGIAQAQSKTTEDLHKKNDEALALFFYNNTLRMLNQNDDKNFDALIENIEKMKFLMIDKNKFGATDYKALVGSYKKEAFEEIMSSRYNGKNFDVFLKEEKGKTRGMIVTVNDSTNLFVLDIVGSIALDKITQFFSTLDESSEIGKKIKDFTSNNDEDSKKNEDSGKDED
ncbi:MAG TPA: DUF4252 domain-containing protein [Ohtaekwangia sp.]|nr:DUF4252 domain-containing protein [Ohtaekwangia sp.]